MRWFAILFCVSLESACGAAPPVVAVSGAPSTERDPIAYVPPPASTGHTGEPVALAAAGGEDQARQLLPRFLEALRDGDEATLSASFAPRVDYLSAEPRRAARDRDGVVQRILIYARRNAIAAELGAGDLVDLRGVVTSRAGAFWHGRAVPTEVRLTDVVLEFPILEPGRAPLHALMGWHLRAVLVVRPGSSAEIVAF